MDETETREDIQNERENPTFQIKLRGRKGQKCRLSDKN